MNTKLIILLLGTVCTVCGIVLLICQESEIGKGLLTVGLASYFGVVAFPDAVKD